MNTHDEHASASPQQAAPEAQPANVHSSGGDDVMRILADVEGQLTRLRTAQKQQDDAVASLTARSRTVRSAEEELEKQRLALKAQQQQVEREHQRLQQEQQQFTERCRLTDAEMRKRSEEVEALKRTFEQQRNAAAAEADHAKRGLADLEQAKAVWQQTRQQLEAQLQRAENEAQQKLAECARKQEEIAAARSQWEKQRQETEAKLAERGREIEAQVAQFAQREAELAKEKQRLASVEAEFQQQRQALETRTRVLEDDRAELLKRIDQAERNVGELIEQVERSQQELAESKQQVQSLRKSATATQEREKALEKALEEAGVKARKVEEESQELLRLADAERGELQNKQEQALRELSEARDAAMAELESARKRMASMQRDLQARDEEIAAKDKRLTDSQSKLTLAGQKLAEFAQILSEQTPQLEKGAAALAMVQEQADQIDRLTKQLAELQLASDPEEIQRRDKRIEELTDALRQARGQTADEAGVAVIEQRNAALEREVADLRLEAQDAQIAAEQARKQLQEYIDANAGQQVQDVALAEHAAKIAALTAELERVNGLAARDLEEKLSAQSKRYQKELEQARGAEEDQTKRLRQRVADLEAQLAQVKAQAASAAENAGSVSSEEQAEYLNRLRAKAEQITQVAEHMRRRRARLEKVKRLVKARKQQLPSAGAQGSAQMRSDQLAQIDRERKHLLEVRKMLATSEYTMIRRWARQRAAYTVAALAMIVALCAAGSWLAVSYFHPTVRSVSVVIEARSRAGAGPLSDEQRTAWTQWHADLVRNAAFQQTLAKRMGERSLQRWSQSDAVGARIDKELTVAGDDPGMIMFSLAGADTEEMCSFLDVLAGTVVSESNREASKRIDNASAVATGERKEDGRVRYASLNPIPVRDDRLTKGLPIMGISFGVMFMLMIALYLKFMRSKRVFEEENANLFGDAAAMPA
jgi:chromosome segregation ATPase